MARLDGVIRTKTADGKMQLWVIGALPPVLCFGLNFAFPNYLDLLTTTLRRLLHLDRGRVVLGGRAHPRPESIEHRHMSQRVLILGYLCIGAFAIALFLVAYTVASAPSSPSNPLGLRGLKRQRVLATNESWARVEPLIRWMGIRVSGILTESQKAALDEQLSLAGDWMGITPEEYVGLSILSGLACAAAGGLMGLLTNLGMLLVIIVGLAGLALPYMQISGAAQDRLKDISRGLPYAIDLMALAMGAGLDFPGAVRQVVQKSSNPEDPMVEEFTLIMQSLNIGRMRKDTLAEFARRAPVDAVKEFCGSLDPGGGARQPRRGRAADPGDGLAHPALGSRRGARRQGGRRDGRAADARLRRHHDAHLGADVPPDEDRSDVRRMKTP